MERICSSSTFEDWMRSFLPLRSVGTLTGKLAENDLNPLSQ